MIRPGSFVGDVIAFNAFFSTPLPCVLGPLMVLKAGMVLFSVLAQFCVLFSCGLWAVFLLWSCSC